MNLPRIAVAWTIPAGALLLLAVGLFARRTTAPPPLAEAQPKAMVSSPWSLPAAPELSTAEPRTEIDRAIDVSRFESTFQNYRSAVVTGNDVLRAALRPVLLRSREQAFRLARAELEASADPSSRDLALQVFESLKR